MGGVGALDVSWPPKEEKDRKMNKKPKKLKVDWEKTIKKNQTEEVIIIVGNNDCCISIFYFYFK